MERLIIVITALLFTISSVIAGTTGKIAGRVFDARTKEPLVGANVYLEGTNIGASTDADGEFYMINVPVGTYT
ncbi:MAG TPA: carboxypeptidase-like regulatory domain-containing protein, partial [Caldithrix abyssi]|nr:carboxypeptidase-like regulatory domain-containing protein [Caldithrix abyssi]